MICFSEFSPIKRKVKSYPLLSLEGSKGASLLPTSPVFPLPQPLTLVLSMHITFTFHWNWFLPSKLRNGAFRCRPLFFLGSNINLFLLRERLYFETLLWEVVSATAFASAGSVWRCIKLNFEIRKGTSLFTCLCLLILMVFSTNSEDSRFLFIKWLEKVWFN